MRAVDCVICGTTFEAKRPSAKYCSERCKKRAQRRPKPPVDEQADAAAAAVATVLPAPSDGFAGGALTRATLAELEKAKRLETALGQAALLAAVRLDALGMTDTGAGFAALVKTHREALAEATKDAETEADPLDQIRGAAALKLIAGGRA